MKDEIAIRAASEADARGIAHVLVDGWQTTYVGILPATFLAAFNYDQHEVGTRELLRSLPMSSAVFVADDRGSVVGVALVREANQVPNEFTAELDAIYVLASMQRHKIGSRLLQCVVRWLKMRNHRSLSLWVLRDNPHRHFYDRLGGELLPQEKQADSNGTNVTSVSYGWRNLDALGNTLDGAIWSESA